MVCVSKRFAHVFQYVVVHDNAGDFSAFIFKIVIVPGHRIANLAVLAFAAWLFIIPFIPIIASPEFDGAVTVLD